MLINLNKGQTKEQIAKFDLLIEEYINSEMTQFQFLNSLQEIGIFYEDKFNIINKSLIKFNNIVFNIFKKNKVDIFPYAGTLLGIIRDKNFIEHDDDCDWAASFYHLHQNFDIIKSELKKLNISIFKVGEKAYDNGYYFYKLKTNEFHKIELGSYYFKFQVEGDIFPILYLNDSKEYSEIYNFFFLSNNYSEMATHNRYLRSVILKKLQALSEITNDISIKNKWEKILDENKISWDKKLHKYYSEKFISLYDSASLPNKSNMYILSPGAVIQSGFEGGGIKKIKTKNGELIYRDRTNPKESLVCLYGYWEKPSKIKYIHSLSKNKIID